MIRIFFAGKLRSFLATSGIDSGRFSETGKRGRNCNRTTVADINSTKLSEPNASMAGLWAAAAANSDTPHSTSIHISVIA
jgi:hypothetical protein